MKQNEMPAAGTPVTVKIKGQPVAATYHSWSEKYSMPLVKVDGKVIPRVFSLGTADAAPVGNLEAVAVPAAADPESAGRTYSVNRHGTMFCYVNGELRSQFKVKEINIHAASEV